MKATPIPAVILAMVTLSLPACELHKGEHAHEEHHKLVVTTPQVKDVTVTQPYVCRICAQGNILEVKALQEGYLEPIQVKEGQFVKAGQELFKVLPTLYKTRLDAEVAEAQYAKVEWENAQRLGAQRVISPVEVSLYAAKLAKAEARVAQAQAELNFTSVTAKFDGFIDRLEKPQGSLVKKEDLLTTLSDNSVMWVYFNVPEARYFDFKRRQPADADPSRLELVDSRIELKLADGTTYPHETGNTVIVEGVVDFATGNFKFRSDFKNPNRLLRHGQTGTILIHRTLHNSTVIPQRATFEILDKMYVWVVGEDHKVHQRAITVLYELEDIFVIGSGLDPKDKIILEGVSQVHDGDKAEDVEFRKPGEALARQKQPAQ